jgi:purine catabolism regulator
VSFRLVDFLALPPVARGAPRVVAGAGHLERDVRWAHVFESREIRDAIRGGEVLLTTGIELAGMPPQEVDSLVADLARLDVAAFALELGSVHLEPPPPLVAACERQGLPLVTFAVRTRFVEITQAVAEIRLNAEVTRLRRAVDVQARLRETVQEGLGAGALVSALSEALDGQVLLEWEDGSSVSSAGDEGLDAAFLDALDAWREGRPSPLLTQRVAAPGRRAGWLHALVAEPTELDTLALSETAFVLVVSPATEAAGAEVESGERAQLVRRIAQGRVGSAADVRRRARSLGVDLSGGPLAVVVLRDVERPGEVEAALAAPALVEHAAGRRARAIVAVRGADVTAAIERDVAPLCRGPRALAAAAGVGVRGDEPWQLAAAFEDADRAALAAQALGQPVRLAEGVGVLGVLAAAVLAGERPAEALGARDERLLGALVESGFAVAPAARRLGLSRQALYDELRRAGARLGGDLLSRDVQVELSLRLLGHRMQRACEDGASGW